MLFVLILLLILALPVINLVFIVQGLRKKKIKVHHVMLIFGAAWLAPATILKYFEQTSFGRGQLIDTTMISAAVSFILVLIISAFFLNNRLKMDDEPISNDTILDQKV